MKKSFRVLMTRALPILVLTIVSGGTVYAQSVIPLRGAHSTANPTILTHPVRHLAQQELNLTRLELRVMNATQTELEKLATISPSVAQSTATRQFSNAEILSARLAVLQNNVVYVCTLMDGVQQKVVIIDVGNGGVINSWDNPAPGNPYSSVRSSLKLTNADMKSIMLAQQAVLQQSAKIVIEEAKTAVLKASPGGQISSESLNIVGQHLVYQFDLTNGRKHSSVLIDAMTGKVLQNHRIH
jgi:uncharacterized membrane protein YkoI